jgi:hypothetical protein
MRFSLGGFIAPLDPLVLTLVNGVPFLKADYVDLGYTKFDVLCIGAAGGRGGNAAPPLGTGGSYIAAYGGGGAGGGMQIVSGLLSSLPSSCAVVVGAAGADGTDDLTPGSLAAVTNGGDGGLSSFNGTLCRGSGGKGGQCPTTLTDGSLVSAYGGEGGKGNKSTPGSNTGPTTYLPIGGGGGQQSPYIDPTTAADGRLNWTAGGDPEGVGYGGGGGGGGVKKFVSGVPTVIFNGGPGGAGPASDIETRYRGTPGVPTGPGLGIGPGGGGGAGGGTRVTPFTHILRTYGSKEPNSTPNGAVVIRLT